jgi:exonuclease III
VCTLVRDDVLERYEVSTKDVEWDLEGRVLCTEIVPRPHIDIAGTTTTSPSWQEAKIRRDKEWRDESTEASKRKRDKLVVVNGYWVNGTSAPWRDSSTGAIIGTRHDIKRLFHSRMLALSRSYESAGYHVIHIGDMNIARSAIDGYPGIRLGDQHVKNRADFNLKFFDMPRVEGGFHGVDVWRYVYGERRKYSYHGRGIPWGSSCDRVDLCVVSRSVVLGVEEQAGNDDGPGVGSALVGTDICDNPTDRGHSDHCPLWVAVDMERLGVKCEIG